MEKLNFQKYYPLFLDHIKRHFKESGVPGSIFTSPDFDSPKKVIDYAYSLIENEYKGVKLIKEVDLGQIIGLDALIPLSEVPEHCNVKREIRIIEDDEPPYTVYVVTGIPLRETSKMVIIAEPVPGENGIHAFSSIYPGRYAPDFSDKEFWETHAFIKA